MTTLRVLTLNIWNRMGPWDARLLAIHREMKGVAPDIIGLQEVINAHSGDGLDQASLIAAPMGFHVAWVAPKEHEGAVFGNAVVSRWPIKSATAFALPTGGTDEARSLVFAEIASPFGTIPFFVTHLNWKFHHGFVRELQVRAIAEHVARVEASASFPPILVGDFNAEPDAQEIRFVRGLASLDGASAYFIDAFARANKDARATGITFSPANTFAAPLREPARRIDYIFVRPDDRFRGEPIASRVCFDKPIDETFASDHFGVVADLRAE